MKLTDLRRPPFGLDAAGLDWVKTTRSGLDLDQKLGQIMMPFCRDTSEAALRPFIEQGVGGIFRPAATPVDAHRAAAAFAAKHSAVPLLQAADIEFSERNSFGDGTPFPNAMGVGAAGDIVWAERMGRLAGREGRYAGINWTFTPVVDLSINPGNAAVNTRSYGSDPKRVAAIAAAYIAGIQAEGVAATAKHWPGDGIDQRDQHYMTSVNSLDMKAWRASFGLVFKAAIAAGVKCIMPGHIALPAYSKGKSGRLMPATLRADLIEGLLREGFGFNGLVVSDALGMAGFEDAGPHAEIVPMCVAAGCDLLLFPSDIAADKAHLRRALDDGRLSMRRLDEAVTRVLALKASLGLHRDAGIPDEAERQHLFAGDEHRQWAKGVAEALVTLVRDDQQLLPLSPRTHRRLLILRRDPRQGVSGPLPPLAFPDFLRDAGFDVTIHEPGKPIDPNAHDAAIYLLAEEAGAGKVFLHAHFDEMHGPFPASMARAWHVLPTAIISFGTPYHAGESPACKTVVNAYSPIRPVEEAVVAALTGKIPFAGKSPVDAFGGLPH
jgi:beta-N-acetylhexosaminidase